MRRNKYYNLKLRVKLKEESCIMLTQENSIEFPVQSVYIIMLAS